MLEDIMASLCLVALFGWDDILGNENERRRLMAFLGGGYGIYWGTAKIEKIDDGRVINVFTENHMLSLILNDEKTKVTLRIDDGRTAELRARTENSKLYVYDERVESDASTLIYLIRMDSERNEIGNVKVANVTNARMDSEKLDSFFSETYKYAENKKGKIQKLPQEKGLISIKDLKIDRNKYIQGFYSTDKYNSSYYSNFVTVSGLIRDIKSESGGYYFGIDDGTGVMNLRYNGGLGDIKEGDKVFVKLLVANDDMVFMVSKNQIPTSANTAKSDGAESATKTPGFEVIIGVAAVFFAWRKIISK